MPADLSNHAPPVSGRYCRGCYYDLRASVSQCPECGRAFDAADPRTTRRRPPRGAWRWAAGVAVVLVLLAAVPGVLLAWLYQGRKSEDRALAALGGLVIELERGDAYPRLSKFLPVRWKPLAERVQTIALAPAATDTDVAHLARMTQIRELSLHNTQVTDAGLAHLARMTQLRELYLHTTQVTDAGLAHLTRMTQMHLLSLDGTKITDAGLLHLAGMTRVDTLNLNSTQITDMGLAHLAGMTHMRVLYLYSTQITDAGLGHLAGMTQMQVLWLGNTKITDEGLLHLSGMTQMHDLYLSGTQITDASLAHLARLTQMWNLWLPQGEQVSDDAVAKLKLAMPKANIRR